ncbi:hypothetical protein BDN72DRAFT_863423 [Pluteus cervinus]|uniref:Uncharacterized protein n=1 Tax=Pluteus cervinus TaxID=181527 RepID=A0ACD3A7F5_9AGAR|nr:hypothetical protein BDN72DRAFT_863423 [Pluteus cervinus]
MTNQQLSSCHQSRIYDFFKTLANPFVLRPRPELVTREANRRTPEVPVVPVPLASALVERKKTTTTTTTTTTITTTTRTRTYPDKNPDSGLPGSAWDNPIILDGAGDLDEVEVVSGPTPRPVRRIYFYRVL